MGIALSSEDVIQKFTAANFGNAGWLCASEEEFTGSELYVCLEFRTQLENSVGLKLCVLLGILTWLLIHWSGALWVSLEYGTRPFNSLGVKFVCIIGILYSSIYSLEVKYVCVFGILWLAIKLTGSKF